MVRDGELWERIISVPLISGTGSGLWPTPRARDAKAGIKLTPTIQRRVMQRMATLGQLTIFQAGGGPLNPNWVEWLMGWPIGHTALEPLEMDRFQQWQQQHGGS